MPDDILPVAQPEFTEPAPVPAEAPLAPAPEPIPEAAPVIEAMPSKTDAIVDEWLQTYLHNSPVSRFTEGWNHLSAAVLHLKDALNAN